ncbi:MAG: MBL fold metallo-hydrolase [Chloroflexota bacterium]
MIITWMGHSCFLLKSEQGLTVLTDPYQIGGDIQYAPVRVTPDIVTVSHDHHDHNAVSAVPGKPEVVRDTRSKVAKGIEFKGVPTYHDSSEGKKRGANTAFCFTMDRMRLCHLGDLGHALSTEQAAAIGAVDILFVPVGGNYTIDAGVATRVCDQLGPRVVLPMHYKTARIDFPIAGVEEFIRGKKNVRQVDASDVEFRAEELPAATEVVVLKPTP